MVRHRLSWAAAAAAVALTACMSPWEGSGEVVELRYEAPERRVRDGGSICMSYDEYGFCASRIQLPDTTYWTPERFVVVVSDSETDELHSVTIAQSRWDDCNLGDWFATTTGACE